MFFVEHSSEQKLQVLPALAGTLNSHQSSHQVVDNICAASITPLIHLRGHQYVA